MATYTTNLNLKKPAQSDKIRIADINNNMDDIDAAFGAIGNDSVATQMGNIQDALAIVAVGDSHAAITAGQYVYVKSHETLDTGLYVASANIAQNGALSSSNLTADTAGGLNALNSKITNVDNGSLSSGIQWFKMGNLVEISFNVSVAEGISVTGGSYAYVDYIPVGIRPLYGHGVVGTATNTDGNVIGIVGIQTADGRVFIQSATTAVFVRFSMIYCI